MASETDQTGKRKTPVDLSQLHSRYEIEDYTPERIAEFLLNNAVSAEDYRWAREEARRLGVNPDQIPHEPPPGV